MGMKSNNTLVESLFVLQVARMQHGGGDDEVIACWERSKRLAQLIAKHEAGDRVLPVPFDANAALVEHPDFDTLTAGVQQGLLCWRCGSDERQKRAVTVSVLVADKRNPQDTVHLRPTCRECADHFTDWRNDPPLQIDRAFIDSPVYRFDAERDRHCHDPFGAHPGERVRAVGAEEVFLADGKTLGRVCLCRPCQIAQPHRPVTSAVLPPRVEFPLPSRQPHEVSA